jgi:hypothetical protein
MDDCNINNEGFLYILEVKDIDLPVCKIGMTTRNSQTRCAEINNSSTGDFIWEVAHQVSVNDCRSLETLVHKKLNPLRQKNREFFNINADVAYDALLSIIENQNDIKKISIDSPDIETSWKIKKPRKRKGTISKKIDPEYIDLLQMFTSLLNIKGTPFGQLNKPSFGMSDGNEGVQWNIVVLTNTKEVRLGVNLEGKKYSNWPVASLILSELREPTLQMLNRQVRRPSDIYIQFLRDAWQVTSRPAIKEQTIGRKIVPICDLSKDLWNLILMESIECLNADKSHRGRNKQQITLANKPKNGEQKRTMEVSPHLIIWTPIDMSGNIELQLKRGLTDLRPIYEWMMKTSQP